MAESAKLLFDDIDSEFLDECKRALGNFGSFESYEAFEPVFYRAVRLVLQYHATPDTLHLYLNDLTDEAGQTLEYEQLEFLYLQVLRVFSEYPFSEMTPDGYRGIYRREWKDNLISCTPCPCDYTATSCSCKKGNDMRDGEYDEADEESCKCHHQPTRNLYRLIYPITESGDFDYLKLRLELLPDNHERLKLLIEEKTEFEQRFGEAKPEADGNGLVDIGFTEKCRLEIDKLKALAELDNKANESRRLIDIPAIEQTLTGLSDDIERYEFLNKKLTLWKKRLRRATAHGDIKLFQDGVAWIDDKVKELEKIRNFSDRNSPMSVANEYDPNKRGLTRQLAMLLLDELFPNLKDASNTAKAEFLALLTGWDASGLRNKWSDYQRGNSETLAQDAAKVAEWKKKLKISD